MMRGADGNGRPFEMERTRRIFGWLAIIALLSAMQAAQAGDVDPAVAVKNQLHRMMQALRTLNYAGVFVYLHGSQLESLEITHNVHEGRELQRLVSLNGTAREVRRNQQAVTCVMPDAQAVSVDRRAPAKGLWPDLDLNRMQGQYLLHPLGEFRVAGRDASVVGIIPRDEFRYGYRFYLDMESGLPLKTDLMDEKAQPLEQIMFTSLTLDSDTAVNRGEPLERTGFRTVVRNAPLAQAPNHQANWEFQGLPNGFALQVHNHWPDESGRLVEHFVLSDGLASVSVYVEEGSSDGLQAGAHVGAVNAWGGRVAGRQVTAVGEVPENTVRKVVESMRYLARKAGE
jgi:sigma-E factor negative regulatory protein RseB